MSLAYATIQRKILPQLAGLMTLEMQDFCPDGQINLWLEFNDDVIHDAVRDFAHVHNFEYNGSSIYIGAVRITFHPK